MINLKKNKEIELSSNERCKNGITEGQMLGNSGRI